jgi:oligopeptide/dipeptide ABC transporter ATP-binding protein
MTPLLEVQDLTKHFPLGGFGAARPVVRAVDGVSFTIAPGETLGLVGESGCGKSTIARCILRLEQPSAGRIGFAGEDLATLPEARLRPLRAGLQMVYQDPTAALNPRLSVRRMVGEPLLLHGALSPAEREARLADILEETGLGQELAGRYPHELSGGQRQRVNIARAIASRPSLVVLDEPTSALDVSLRARIILLLQALRERHGLAYLFISHDLATVRHLAQQVAVMYLGVIVEQAPAAEIFARPQHPYTRALIGAVPVPDPDVRLPRLELRGEVPSPIGPRAGCGLRARCPLARDVCATPVALREVAPGHRVACHLV